MKAFAVLVAVLTARIFDAVKLEAFAPAAAEPASPAAVPASPGPAPPGLEALHINFEIKNFNYMDLTKETCPKKVKVAKKSKKKGGKPSGGIHAPEETHGNVINGIPLGGLDKFGKAEAPDVKGAIKEVQGNSDEISKQVETEHRKNKRKTGVKTGIDFTLPWMESKKKDDDDDDSAASFLQLGACAPLPDLAETKSTECTTVMDVLRTAIKETVRGIISCLYAQSMAGPAAAPGPAPMINMLPVSSLPAAPAGVSGLVPLPVQMPAGASFLQSRSPAPAFAASPAPGPAMPAGPDVKIFVTFSPGREMEGGRSTMVEIAFIDRPANGVDDVAMAMPLIEQSIGSGLFHKQVKKALHAVTGIKPKLRAVEMKMKEIVQWAVDKCENHIKAIVGQFSLHYTRNQVPMALYNECTNFMTRMSFSHDYVLDPQDTVRCRRATAKFAKHWNFGQNATGSDFEDMCQKACEAKYGRNAPKCNIATGDNMLNQPL